MTEMSVVHNQQGYEMGHYYAVTHQVSMKDH